LRRFSCSYPALTDTTTTTNSILTTTPTHPAFKRKRRRKNKAPLWESDSSSSPLDKGRKGEEWEKKKEK